MAFLLDTNVVSELRRRSPDPRVVAWHTAHADVDAYLSVLVVGEVRAGIEKLRPKDGEHAERLEVWLDGLVTGYRDRILPVTSEIAQEWGRLNVVRRPPAVDGLIVATAKVHRLTLVTRNVAYVTGCDVPVVDPFASPVAPA